MNWHQKKAEFHRKQKELAWAANKPKAEAAHKLAMDNYLAMVKELYN